MGVVCGIRGPPPPPPPHSTYFQESFVTHESVNALRHLETLWHVRIAESRIRDHLSRLARAESRPTWAHHARCFSRSEISPTEF